VIVLVLNCGSSSLKFQVIDAGPDATAGGQLHRRARGSIDRIGVDARLRFEAHPCTARTREARSA
jgi:acetate kinase